MREDRLNGVFGYAARLEKALIPIEEDEDYNDGRYPFIPLPPFEFTKHLLDAKDLHDKLYGSHSRPLFLDVGSGIGTKMLLAGHLGLPAHGIEMNPKYTEIARKKFHIGSSNMFEMDARKFPYYQNYRIIYFYCPMRDMNLQIELEKVIYEKARDGAILIEVLKMNDPREDEPLLHRLDGPIFIKTSNEKLLEKAKAFFNSKQHRVTKE